MNRFASLGFLARHSDDEAERFIEVKTRSVPIARVSLRQGWIGVAPTPA